jgi:Ca2+-binding EF-hand superfamily protein
LEKYKEMNPITRLEKLFKLTDRDNDGYIGFNDLKGSSMAVKFQLSDEDIARLIETFGKPNTPGVDFVDFRDILLNSS